MEAPIIVLVILYLLLGGHFQAQHGFWAHQRPRGPDFDHEAHSRAGWIWLAVLLGLCAVLVAMFGAVAG